MAINVADQFQYLGKKSLDARVQYATLAEMKAVTDANINEGCFAYCVETDKYYTFKSTNTVDATLGKWREYGVEEMPSEDMADVITPLPSARPAYHKYSTEEQIVGEWIDGSTIYEKVISCGQVPQAVTAGTRVNKEVAHEVANMDRVVSLVGSCFATASSHVCPPIMPVQMAMNNTNTPGINIRIDATNIYIVNSNTAYNGITDVYVTIQYTKA